MESFINNLIDSLYMLWTSFHHNAPYNLLLLGNGETKR